MPIYFDENAELAPGWPPEHNWDLSTPPNLTCHVTLLDALQCTAVTQCGIACRDVLQLIRQPHTVFAAAAICSDVDPGNRLLRTASTFSRSIIQTSGRCAALSALYTRSLQIATPVNSHVIAHANVTNQQADPDAVRGVRVTPRELFLLDVPDGTRQGSWGPDAGFQYRSR